MSAKKASKSSDPSSSKTSYATGDKVLAKIPGYPAWPGYIVEPVGVSKAVIKARPPKGHYYLVRFYPKADYSWTKSSDLSILEPAAIDKYLETKHKADGVLRKGYQVARDSAKWEEENPMDVDETLGDYDELEDDDDKPKAGAKRKATSAAPKKESSKKPKVDKAPKPAKNNGKTKSSANIESEDDEGGEKKAAPKADDQDAEVQKVKDWRHKLQRSFLGKVDPKAEDMPAADEVFTTIEGYTTMTIEQLQASKIGKVMRKILTKDNIPREGEFKFKERAQKLITQWQTQLAAAGSTEDGPAPAPAPAPAPTTTTTTSNGDAPAPPAPAPASTTSAPAPAPAPSPKKEKEVAVPVPDDETDGKPAGGGGEGEGEGESEGEKA